jgi:dihydroorotase
MTSYVISGGRVIDPATGRDEVADVLVAEGKVTEIGKVDAGDAQTLDATGCVVAPGLVDLHTHLREPGREDEETIASGSAAAAAGGFTAVCAMPNTDPVADNASVVEKVWALGNIAGLVDVVPSGALTKGQNGAEMADIGEMHRSKANVRLFTDDGHGVQDALMARRLMEYLNTFDAIYAEHCEVESLSAGGHMHEGSCSLKLGLRGIPAAAEELMVARDIELAKLTGCRLHLLHLSTSGSVDLVRRAKAAGLDVTAEATPHHFTMTEEALESYDPNAKVNPPLRADADRAAVIEGLVDGTIDAIATDHAPHAREEKDQEISLAPPGLIGLETALALTITMLVEPGHLDLAAAVRLLSTRPAAILGLEGHGSLAAGRPANLVAFDPTGEWVVGESGFVSKSSNTPLTGARVRGKVKHTLLRGIPTFTGGRVAGEVTV